MTKTYKPINEMTFVEALVAIEKDPERVFFRQSRGGTANYIAMFNTEDGVRFDGLVSISDRINFDSDSELVTILDFLSPWFEISIDRHDMEHDELLLVLDDEDGLDSTYFTNTSVNYILNSSKKWRDIIVAIYAKDKSTGETTLVYSREESKR